MPSTPAVPARLFIIMAREAPIGLIFRRGPAKWTQIIKWNTQTDTFEYGAWFNGQIYPARSDLSPDGTKLIYFATSYRMSQNSNNFPSAWTAISKTPWLTALAVWPNMGTYFGGGLFETDTTVWPCIDRRWTAPHPNYPPRDLEVSYDHRFWDDNCHLIFRLERDGWKAIEKYPVARAPIYHLQPDGCYELTGFTPGEPYLAPIRTVHEKTSTQHHFTLVMTSVYDYPWNDKNRTFVLRNNNRKSFIPLPDVVWADWDQQGRLIYAKEGKLLTAEIIDDELRPRELADFNGLKPRRTKSPEWAREW